MYKKYFGLQKRPFVLSPDPGFLFLSRGHDLALTHLEYGLLHNAGFVALTGEIGAGKTTLLKHFFDKASDSLDIAMIFNTHLDSHTLLEMIVKEYGLAPPTGSKSDLIAALYDHFMAQYARRGRCVIVVDEAQNLPLEAFEELRMLSNIETGGEQMVQIILVGQPQLRDRLLHPALAQLTQRISVHYHLAPLSREEVGGYIGHRLDVSGWSGPEPLFTEEAVSLIAEVSGGVPRIINSLCDASLTYAFADDARQISRETVEKVVADNPLLLASFDQGKMESEPDSGGCAPTVYNLPVAAEADSLIYRMAGRLEALEMRVRTLEGAGQEKTTLVLQEMLDKEREKTLRNSQRIVSLIFKNKELQAQLDELKKEPEVNDSGGKARRGWRLFGGEKR